MRLFSRVGSLPFPTRFIEGTRREIEELFDGGLPPLPEGQEQEGRETLLVELHPGLKKAAREAIDGLYRSATQQAGADPVPYINLVRQLLWNILENERRLGLLNLFWLAHSKEVSEVIQDYFSQPGIRPLVRYQIHPLLRGLYRDVFTSVWQTFRAQRPEKLKYGIGADFSTALIEAVFEEQLPLTEVSVARINLAQVLGPHNRRFKLGFVEFKEIFALCRERVREGFQRNEVRLLEAVRRALPTIPRESYADERVQVKILFNTRVLQYLLLDYEGLVPKLMARLAANVEGEKRRAQEVLEDYLDLIQALKRTEVIDILRRAITHIPPGLDDAQLRTLFVEGRLYRFLESTEILNSARKVTVVFADLRGFTSASEGGVSERELTEELYETFDPLASLVEASGGKIDKFTGDGAMITFGAVRLSGADELNALRTAMALQDLMGRLRQAGRTRFRMGISVHTGRAQLAHFLVDERTIDTTVIGRHVNTAGRLCGSGEKTKQSEEKELLLGEPPAGAGEESGPPPPRQAVWVEEETGILYNSGIAVSGDTVEELARIVKLESLEAEGGSGFRFFDEVLQKNVLLEYVGDAKFKGIGRSIPVYHLRTSA